jgi:diketogulonate reductase-like aldo/keto reductase
VLAFLTRRPSVLAIPKSSNPVHVEELAHTVEIDAATIDEIDALFPLKPWRGLHTL